MRGSLGIGPVSLLIVVGVPLAVLWALALVDLVKRDERDFPPLFPGVDRRVFWTIVVLLMSGIGAFLYYLMVMRPCPRKRP